MRTDQHDEWVERADAAVRRMTPADTAEDAVWEVEKPGGPVIARDNRDQYRNEPPAALGSA